MPPWPAQPFYKTPVVDRRFELVKIAFEKVLREHYPGSCWQPTQIAKRTVELADAVLAVMDKEPTTDTNEKGSENG